MVPQLSYIFLPFVATLFLVGIYVYLGQHVLKRGIIFVDIAIAQIAALGLTFAYYLGYDPKSLGASLYALVFAIGGAMLFAFAKPREELIPHEAIIGICYVVASGLAILMVDMAKDPHGAETIQYLLVGNISWVSKQDIFRIASVILPVGFFHYWFFPKFYAVTFEPQLAEQKGLWIPFWDFLFYLSFGMVVTSSVKVCGVLLVFTFLVIPSVCIGLFVRAFSTRLILSWILGILVSFVGLLFSWSRPSGPTIVFFFAATLAIFGVLKYILTSSSKGKALLKLIEGLGIFVGLLALVALLFPSEEHHKHRTNLTPKTSPNSPQNTSKYQNILNQIRSLTPDDSTKNIQIYWSKLNPKEKKEFINELLKVANQQEDFSLKLVIAKLLLTFSRKKSAWSLLYSLLQNEKCPPFIKEEAAEDLQKSTKQNFGYDFMEDVETNQKALEKWRKWLQAQGVSVH
ncbi:MAG: metal ABC transporter permease [Planctomycetota bacterium]|nr:MAG: metal ABC transporter permease [Planctomycetota bacterium]